MAPHAGPVSSMQRVAGLLVKHPQSLLAHAEGYLALLTLECELAWAAGRTRMGLAAVAMVCGTGAVLLAGVALMLWNSVPGVMAGAAGPGWVLIAVPAVPAVLAAICVLVMRARPVEPTFFHLRRQLRADLDLLHETGAP